MLSDSLLHLKGVGEKRAKMLGSHELCTIGDLLRHFPFTYRDLSQTTFISDLKDGMKHVCIKARVVTCTSQRTRNFRITIQRLVLQDTSGTCAALFFNQPYLCTTLPTEAYFIGSSKYDRGVITFTPSEWYSPQSPRFIPRYSRIKGISNLQLYKIITTALSTLEESLPDIPPELRKPPLPSVRDAFHFLHSPRSDEDIRRGLLRLTYDQVLQLAQSFHEIAGKNQNAPKIAPCDTSLSAPFTPTQAQMKAIDEIIHDLEGDTAMTRMLIGDVGSGKTFVAASVATALARQGKQTVFLAPSVVLAQQHFESLSRLLPPSIKVGLHTSRQKLKTDCDIVVGTHALMYSLPPLPDAALLIVDEQHKFGVRQRQDALSALRSDKRTPHLLMLSATPIPRSLALLLYGGIDVSTLNEMPKGRIPVLTHVVNNTDETIGKMFEWLRRKMREGDRVFMVCPAIDSNEENITSVEILKQEVTAKMPEVSFGVVHGRLGDNKIVLAEMKKGTIQLVIATTVIEVGVDIPDATIMVIWDADRYGLAQLHQLRGRVGRGTKKSYCFLIPFHDSTHIRYLEQHHDGFEIAQYDLNKRGPGTLLGMEQKGFEEMTSFEEIQSMAKLAIEAHYEYTSPLLAQQKAEVTRLH